MGLLDLIEEHDREGSIAHGVGELPTLLEAHVTWRGPNQPLIALLLVVFAHIEPDASRLVPEEEFGGGLGQFSLAHA